MLVVLIYFINKGYKSHILDSIIPDGEQITIVPPGAGVPADVAAFSGWWEGKWSSQLPGLFIVKELSARSAQVVVGWGNAPSFGIYAGYEHIKAKLISEDPPTLQVDLYGRIFTYVLNKDKQSVAATYEFGGDADSGIFPKKN